MSVLAMLAAILAGRRVLIWCALVSVAVVATATLLTPRRYVSTVSVIPAGAGQVSPLAGLASQFGVSMAPAADASASPAFISKLLVNDAQLLLLASDTLRSDDQRFRMDSLWATDGATEAEQRTRRAERLREVIAVASDLETGVVRVRVTAESPLVAAALASRVVERGNASLMAARRRKLEAEYADVDRQVQSTREALRRAEERQAAFLMANRRVDAPRLAMQVERLSREVTAQASVLRALEQSAAQLTLDTDRATPALRVVEPALVPILPESRGLAVRGVFALVAGLLLGTAIVLLRATLSRQRKEDADAAQMVATHSIALRRELRRPWRLLTGTGAPDRDVHDRAA